MIVTHTRNAHGQRRVYLGGKGSLECWIDPDDTGTGWRLHIAEAVTGLPLSEGTQRDWAIHMLMKLAETLNVSPHDLQAVPFECIAALHSDDPFKGHRTPTPRRQNRDDFFMATSPGITRPRSDFARGPEHHGRSRPTR